MNGRTDSFEGLHVLLVTEDDARAQAIAKALRERRAHVGDVRAGSRDPVALRGADLLVIDARRGASTEARVNDVRSDVRARWASVATIDYTTLANGDGTVDLRALEGIVSRLAGMDKALTERARKEASFETALAPLGPTRTLRALSLSGPTLHVELTDGTLSATVDLANELLVSAFAERKGERWEAWSALARVLGMTDANVVVKHRDHPAAMNIMEPVDQALEGAAQERVRVPEQFTEESTSELSGLRRERRESGAAPAQAASEQASSEQAASAQAVSAQSTGASSAPRARPSSPGTFAAPSARPAAVSPSTASARPAAASTAASARPAAASTSAAPSMSASANPSPQVGAATPSRASHPRPTFEDIPTDAVAPGLLQRMARAPVNDGDQAVAKPAASAAPAPELSIDRSSYGDDDDLDDESYDAGEVTVVADASQLNILRETLGRMDADVPQQPLTSTMPAPPGPGRQDDELAMAEALKKASSTDLGAEWSAEFELPALPDEPLELQPSAKQRAAAAVASEQTAASVSTTPTSKPPAPAKGSAQLSGGATAAGKAAPRAPALRHDGFPAGSERPSAGRTKTRALILVALLVLAAVAVGAMYWSMQQRKAALSNARTKSPAAQTPSR